jgi:hypothetical protein
MSNKKQFLSRNAFAFFVDELFTHYKSYLNEWKKVNPSQHEEDIESIISAPKLNSLPRGKNTIVFGIGKAQENNLEISLNRVLDKYYFSKGKGDRRINIGDFLYKKCNEYNNGAERIEISKILFEIVGYENELDFLQKNDIQESEPEEDSLKKNIENELKGCWNLFFFNNERIVEDARLAKAIVEVIDLDNIIIQDNASGNNITYTGRIDESMAQISNIVYLKFESQDRRKTNLRIAFHLRLLDQVDMAIGHYTNVSKNLELIRGTVILEKIKGELDKERDVPLADIGEALTSDNQKPILKFLEDKFQNYNRIPSKFNNIEDFKEWMEYKNQKPNQNETTAVNKKNKALFISFSVSLGDKELLPSIRNAFKDSGEFGQEEEDIYSFALQKDTHQDSSSHFLFEEIIEEYKKATHHAVIWPPVTNGGSEKKESGVSSEAVWSLLSNKPMVIFIKKENKNTIPKIFTSANRHNKSKVTILPYLDDDDLVHQIKLNKDKMWK